LASITGLKGSSTFGKSLRKSAAQTSPASSELTTTAPTTDPNKPSHKQMFKTAAVINIQQQELQEEKAQ